MAIVYSSFTQPLLDWFDQHGRKDLPWQHPRTAYRVWISEIMLQQTQVKTVIPYFMNFLASFPEIKPLALAAEDEVFAHWSGLGYYSRARNLHKTAKIIYNELHNVFPNNLQDLIKLPGIGPSTGAAIASLAFNKPTPILDGNVKRVLSRYFLIEGAINLSHVNKTLWQLAAECMSQDRCADYTQAIMDMGATCCKPKQPLCVSCPLKSTCLAYNNKVVEHYPQKALKKALPTKQQQFLLLYNEENMIYLEKQPPTGLWGGLWSIPNIAVSDCPTLYVKNTHKLQPITQANELMKFKHSFSHYHLQISALTLQCRVINNQLSECSGRWFKFDELSGLGLAKPVSMIIERFFKNCSAHINIERS